MKTISLISDYNISDAGNETKINNILQQVDIGNDSKITLSLLHCIIDYPATSMLIDHVLGQLAKLNGQKRLLIELSYLLPEQTLINDLLGDSRFFEIEAKKEIPIGELKRVITERLSPLSITMSVEIKDRTGQIRQRYNYGN